MLNLSFDDNVFTKEMNNILEYSVGFLDGAQSGKSKMLENLGNTVIQALKEFIDSNARVDPAMLQHVYEWYQNGSPNARLFDIDYSISGRGLTINSSFRQSSSVKDGSNVPFYDKARIMENGIPVTITPRKSSVLVFESNGETVFTKNPVTVDNPGGDSAQGSYESVFNSFFNNYFTQSFLVSSGIFSHLQRPEAYKLGLSSAKVGGKSTGFKVGYNWIARGGTIY